MHEQPVMLNPDVLGKGRADCNYSLSLGYPDSPELRGTVLMSLRDLFFSRI